MGFISYAKNFEDVMLWRALKHIKHGTYIDIGAEHPEIHSASKAFYDYGWRGTHFTDNAQHAARLSQSRPDEEILNIPLDTALKTVNTQPIHWLKINAKGREVTILEHWDTKRLRPWIITLATTHSTATQASHTTDWDGLFKKADYSFAYFDGMNRFYIANEHPKHLAAFTCPPNYFDHFTVYATEKAQKAEHELRKILRDVYNSKSWSLTRPLREGKRMLKRVMLLFQKSATPLSPRAKEIYHQLQAATHQRKT